MKGIVFIHPCSVCRQPYESIADADLGPDYIELVLRHGQCETCYTKQEKARDMQ